MIGTKKFNKYDRIAFRIVVGIIVVFGALFMYSTCTDSTGERKQDNKMLAYNYAEDFVKKRLKSPSTAKFPGLYEKSKHVTPLGGREYKINSWVDSQNGFGAMIRSNFSCKIIFEGNSVRVENLKIQ
ncbi:hypothetical protein OOZ15_04110 [Galbibacter sp. EGI 63066]|uniref:hypothetical protein n=1 Tax=Galbibacter sp. EGI 63066 TaxID=2993559 RepID=UPI002248F4C6|nr:hypothetical protein [Galbibacter sp. EGI 63066]MCX2679116.1 hypothetical protein [Galbibacter sp. EGI 63066]